MEFRLDGHSAMGAASPHGAWFVAIVKLRVPLICAAILLASLARFAPSTRIELPDLHHLGAVVGSLPATSRVPALQTQYFHPWYDFVPGRYDQPRWRLLLPCLAHWTHLPLGIYFLLPRIGGLALVFLATYLVWRETGSELYAVLACALVATSSAFFVAEDWIEWDPFWVLALLVYVFSDSPLTAFVCAALGPWIDERFVLMLPAVALLRMARGRRGTLLPTALGVAPYLAVRAALLLLGDHSVMDQLHEQRLFCPWFPVGWAEGFRFGWIVMVAGMGYLIVRQPRISRATLLTALGLGLGLIVWLAYDTSRSIAVLTPFLVQGIITLHGHRRAIGIMAACAVLNFAAPAGHVIADAYFPLTPVWTPPTLGGQFLDAKPGPWLTLNQRSRPVVDRRALQPRRPR